MHFKLSPTQGRRFLLIGALAFVHIAALAAPFESTTRMQNTALQLNGAGSRSGVAFKTYDIALYTQVKVTNLEDLLALPGPKRLSFVALHEISSTDLGLAFIKGLKANATKEQVQSHAASARRMVDVFSGQSKLMPGDTFSMDFMPGSGTTFYVKGKPQGAPVGDAEFFNLVLKIWMGPTPVDASLKDALLGKERT